MVPPRALLRLASGLLLVLGLSSTLVFTTVAQDRSVPRFGPLVAPDTVQAAPADLGRLWSVAQPPLAYLNETYNVQSDKRGLRHMRLGTVRLPGCSGTLVSPEGLVLTAARCVRPFLRTVQADSARGTAFVAADQNEERSLPDLYAERIVGVETVTEAVAQEGRAAVQARLQDEAGPNERVDITVEGGGNRSVAYTYRRHDDVRLAFYPDRSVTLSGRLGEPLSYPQHAWDVAVLRVYGGEEENAPLQTSNHLSVRRAGARPGDAVFAVGHPTETRRAETHEQLTLRRDLQLPVHLSVVAAWTMAAQQHVDSPKQAGMLAARLTDARMTRRRLRARLDALRDDYVMDRLRARDRELRGVLNDRSTEEETILDQLASIQGKKRAHADRYRAFGFLMHPEYSSATLRRAILAARAGGESPPNDLGEALSAVPDQPRALDAALMANHLDRLRRHLASDTSLTRTIEQLSTPSSLVRASLFSDPERIQARLREGELPEQDVLFELGAMIADRFAAFQSDWRGLLESEGPLADSLGRVRQRIDDRPIALPQNRALRLADGRIEGYPYNGTVAPPFTTFYGLYEQHYALLADREDLPGAWRSAETSLSRSTPLSTVASTDLGSGAHGGPLLNSSLELVGVVVDGNVQSAAGEYLFLPDRMRTVSVDVRGVIEGLSVVYDAERLVKEMTQEASAP